MFQKGLQFFLEDAGFGLFPADEHVGHPPDFQRGVTDGAGHPQAVDGFDAVDQADDLRHFIGLQVADQVHADAVQTQGIPFAEKFLHPVFTDLADAQGKGAVNPRRLHGFGDGQQGHIGFGTARRGAGGRHGVANTQ